MDIIKYILDLTAYISDEVMYGFSPSCVRALKACIISLMDWMFSVSLEIMKAMYSCSDTKPSMLGSTCHYREKIAES